MEVTGQRATAWLVDGTQFALQKVELERMGGDGKIAGVSRLVVVPVPICGGRPFTQATLRSGA